LGVCLLFGLTVPITFFFFHSIICNDQVTNTDCLSIVCDLCPTMVHTW
jgi:hypothetical protein